MDFGVKEGVGAEGFGPRTPAPGPILFRLRQIGLPLLGSLREPSRLRIKHR